MEHFALQEEARDLLSLWYRERDEKPFATKKFLDPLKLRRWMGNISIIHLHEGEKRFFVALHGAHVARHLGPDFNKKYLEDVIPDDAKADAYAPYELSLEVGLPTYSIQRQSLQNGLFKSLERMALPCSTDDPDRISRFLVWVAPIESRGIGSSSIYTPFNESEIHPSIEQKPENTATLFVLSEDWLG